MKNEVAEAEQHDPATEFADALLRARQALDAMGDDGRLAHHRAALDHFANYVALLGDTNRPPVTAVGTPPRAQPPAHYWLKLELPDGRWTVDYRPLDSVPSVGDIIELDTARSWRVRSLQLVAPQPSNEPLREYLVCAPAA
jgi:hypothetical protein